MSTVETPQQTVLKFLQSDQWKNASRETIAAGLSCAHNESYLNLNPWHYELKDGKLFDPVQNSFVAGTGGLDKQEEEVITQLETWFLKKDSGIAVWISPRKKQQNNHPGYYEEQLTMYRIAYELNPKTFETKKVLFLTSHQFNHKFKNPDEIKRFIFTEEDNENAIFDILDYLEKISSKKIEKEIKNDPNVTKLAAKYAYMHLSGISKYVIVEQMDRDNFLGNNPIGCPPASFSNMTQIFGYSKFSETKTWTYHVGDCVNPGCNRTNVDVGPCSICKVCEKIL